MGEVKSDGFSMNGNNLNVERETVCKFSIGELGREDFIEILIRHSQQEG